MKNGIMIFAAVLVAACAAGTETRDSRPEDMQYRLENERIEALERFEKLKRSCARSGGILLVRRHSGGRQQRTPTAGELKGASCSSPFMY